MQLPSFIENNELDVNDDLPEHIQNEQTTQMLFNTDRPINIEEMKIEESKIDRVGTSRLSFKDPVKGEVVPEHIDNMVMEQCPHCSRKFKQEAARRHIPNCKDARYRPRPPPSLRAKSKKPSTQQPKFLKIETDKLDPKKSNRSVSIPIALQKLLQVKSSVQKLVNSDMIAGITNDR